jgi:hypothetical protein
MSHPVQQCLTRHLLKPVPDSFRTHAHLSGVYNEEGEQVLIMEVYVDEFSLGLYHYEYFGRCFRCDVFFWLHV